MNAVTEVMDELRKALALVDQLGDARDKAERELAELQRRASEALAQTVEWQRERDEALAIVDVLRGVGCNEDGDGPCGVCRKCAYRHGAEYMREACAKRAWDKIWDAGKRTDNLRKDFTAQAVRDALRALPIPEEP